jgi:hypothetical protein
VSGKASSLRLGLLPCLSPLPCLGLLPSLSMCDQ